MSSNVFHLNIKNVLDASTATKLGLAITPSFHTQSGFSRDCTSLRDRGPSDCGYD